MEKPFEIPALLEKMKAGGLELLEEEAKVVVKAVLDWTQDSVILTENKWDDFFLAIRPLVEPAIMPIVDQINPDDNK